MIGRKTFLRLSGASLLALAGRKVIAALTGGGSAAASPVTRWAMVVDPVKCAKAAAGCTKCIDACHAAHNVPAPAERRP